MPDLADVDHRGVRVEQTGLSLHQLPHSLLAQSHFLAEDAIAFRLVDDAEVEGEGSYAHQ
jgi:hypothetical protein